VHPERYLAGYRGILQADAYSGFNALYEVNRKPGPITAVGCWAHARRYLFELADVTSNARDNSSKVISPIAFAAVQKFDAIFALEREIVGKSPDERLAVRRRDVTPLVDELIEWMKRERAKLSGHNPVAKALSYTLRRVDVFTAFCTMGASASATTPLNARCEASHSEESRGCSRDRIAAANVPPSS
jgi:transposase